MRTTIDVEFTEHYSALGAFESPAARPWSLRRFTPYAERLAYAGSGRHHVRPTRVRTFDDAKRAAVSLARDLGDFLWGPFVRRVVGA
jgi:hypothetical protein